MSAKYKAVIFDFDDTLVESRVAKWAHHKHVAKKFYNIDLTDEKIKEHWGKPIDTLIGELYQHSDTLENMYEALISVRDDYLKLSYDGAAEMIESLIEQGIKVAVLSATNKRFLNEDLERLGFPVDKIFMTQGADESEFHKPDPKVLTSILEKFRKEGIQKNEIVCVGDSMIDLKMAQGADMDVIVVTTGLYSDEDFKKAGATAIIGNINEVVKYIHIL